MDIINNSNIINLEYRYLPSILYFFIVASLFFYFVTKSDSKKKYFSFLFFILSLISFVDIVSLFTESNIFKEPDLTFKNEFGGISYMPKINQTSLHFRCFQFNSSENATKTILFEAGTPFYSTIWGNVLKILNNGSSGNSPLNEIKQYCIYDRYGYGWSELKYKGSRNKGVLGLEAVDDLKQYLNELGINDHLMLVGWSYGGIISQLFISQFPDMVDGVILVDSMGLMDLQDYELFKLISKGVKSFNILKYLIPSGITRFLTSEYPLSSGFLNLNDKIIPLSKRLKYSTDILYQSYNNIDASKNELSIIIESITQLNNIIINQNQQFRNSEFMRNKALVVLTADKNEYQPDWVQLQFNMTYYSSNSVQIVNNKTNHFVPLHAPQSIVNAISLCILMSSSFSQSQP